jgi:two-component system cell cycle response regulator
MSQGRHYKTLVANCKQPNLPDKIKANQQNILKQKRITSKVGLHHINIFYNIVITAKTSLDDIVAGFDAGAVDYISKPIKACEVHTRVHTHLQSRALMKQQVVLNHKLQDLETRSCCIINEVTDAVVFVCPPGIIESANPAALSLFGYTEEKMMGKIFVELLLSKHHDDYAEHFLNKQLHEHSQQPPIRENAIEVTGLKHDGTTLPVDLTIKQLALNYPLYLFYS